MGKRLYPDAPAPGGTFHRDVDVVAIVAPPLPQVQVVMQWYDVDDPSDHDGPIDAFDPGVEEPGYNLPDNFRGDQVSPQIALSAPSAPNAQCEVRAVLTFRWTQPGNNVRVAVAGRAEELAPIKAVAPDDRSCLFFDKNGDDYYRTADGDYTLDEYRPSPSVTVTPTLTVWRKLHVEVDSMGAITGNVFPNSTTRVAPYGSGNARSIVYLDTQLTDHDNNQFENGRLTDTNFSQFLINWSYLDSVVVDNSDLGIPSPGPLGLEDDDWLDFAPGEDVPAPRCEALAHAMSKAFVTVLYDLPGQTDVRFLPNFDNTSDDYGVAAQRWDSVGSNSASYWVAYVLGAFQYVRGLDNDPNVESGVLGATPRGDRGGSFVFIETVRDYAREVNRDRVAEEQVTVVHEVGHAFKRYSDPVTVYEELNGQGPIEYVEGYLLTIRRAEKPASR